MMRKKQNAFTLIELLVVISLIAALVGILAVAQKKVKLVARNLRQKAEFHGMEISLELFSTDFKDYPDSDLVFGGGSDYTCGAQRLAEAMLGRDEQGFHPETKWHPNLEPTSPNNLYFTETTLTDRKGPYFELKHTGFYTLDDLWGTGNAAPLQEDECPVLTDVFTFNKVDGVDEKVGSPILYFKADPTKRFRVDATNTTQTATLAAKEYKSWVYDLDDNLNILNFSWLRELPSGIPGNTKHYTVDPDDSSAATATLNPEYFYQQLTQRSDPDRDYYKPYNQNTFLLISAGWDGIYGTKDDITNFNY